MPVNKEQKHRLTISITNEIYNKISKIALKKEWSESKTAAKLIEIGLKHIEQDERPSK